MTPEDFVDNGIAFLDVTLPNWRQLVNWDTFNMKESEKCVLGQTLGYRKTLSMHGRNAGKWAETNGFFVPAKGESTNAKYRELELLWLKKSGV